MMVYGPGTGLVHHVSIARLTGQLASGGQRDFKGRTIINYKLSGQLSIFNYLNNYHLSGL